MSNARNLARLLPNASGQLPPANVQKLLNSNMASGSVIQIATAVNTTEVTVADNTQAVLLSLNFTPAYSNSLILMMVYCGQIKKHVGGANWGGLSVIDTTAGYAPLSCGALTYPQSEYDTRIVVHEHTVINSWSGTRTFQVKGAAAGGNIFSYSFQGNETRLTMMEIAA